MKLLCFVGACVLLFGHLVSGDCNVTLHAQKEALNFTSPNYPRDYGNNENCFWDIYPQTSGYRVVLDMVYVNIEDSSFCTVDALTLYTKSNDNADTVKLNDICGETRRSVIIGNDQHFHVVFKTDSSVTERGFLIRYYETQGDSSCGGPLVATSAGNTITSPGYPNTYPSRQSCTWTITAEHENQTIVLDTEDSELENISPRGTCDSDYVTVYNGRYSSDELGTFCGDQQPVFASGGNSLRVHLQTNHGKNFKGFKMRYKAVDAGRCVLTMPADESPVQLVSPGYPKSYQRKLNCTWTISAPIGYKIEVKITDIFMDRYCENNYLLLSDGPSAQDAQLEIYCGAISIRDVVSSSNYITITYHNDGSFRGILFNLNYKSVIPAERVCGSGRRSAEVSTTYYLTSPGYPGNYANDVSCTWTISTTTGNKIKVEIMFLSLQYSKRCTRDYLRFVDDSTSNASPLGKYCNVSAKNVVSSSNYMIITFHTDNSVTGEGFSLKYTATRGCGEHHMLGSSDTTLIQSPNYPFHYPLNADCEWTVSTDIEGYVIHVKATYFDLEYSLQCSSDYLQLYNVVGVYEYSLGRWCGSDGPDTQSTEALMKVRFHTDDAWSNRGFELAFTAGEKTPLTGTHTDTGSIIGGVVGGTLAVVVLTVCCCAIYKRTKSRTNSQLQRNSSRDANVNTVFSLPLHNLPAVTTTPTAGFEAPPSYHEVVKNDPPPYSQIASLILSQPHDTPPPTYHRTHSAVVTEV
ncbi:tolloid-like protein 2 isoform X1 [Haliotis asinina]|uniref:tolloid-like protein 2 isoform X1 n=1 Tax=Haliotis asinina TaxID=109174 RepID=UPI0035321614